MRQKFWLFLPNVPEYLAIFSECGRNSGYFFRTWQKLWLFLPNVEESLAILVFLPNAAETLAIFSEWGRNSEFMYSNKTSWHFTYEICTFNVSDICYQFHVLSLDTELRAWPPIIRSRHKYPNRDREWSRSKLSGLDLFVKKISTISDVPVWT